MDAAGGFDESESHPAVCPGGQRITHGAQDLVITGDLGGSGPVSRYATKWQIPCTYRLLPGGYMRADGLVEAEWTLGDDPRYEAFDMPAKSDTGEQA